MAEEEEIADNVLRLIDDSAPNPVEELDLESSLVDDLGFDRNSLRNLAFVFNKDEFFKPLGVGLIPDDVADCATVEELVSLVQNELNNERPERRSKPNPPNRPGKK